MKTAIASSILYLISTVSAMDYNPTLSNSVVYYAAAAYCDFTKLITWQCGTGCKMNPGMLLPVSIFEDYLEGT